MNGPLRVSKLRLIAGGILLALAAVLVLFVLPDASQQKAQKYKASEDAKKSLTSQRTKLAALTEEDQRLTNSRKRLETLLGSMPDQSVGRLQWELSRRLYDLAQKNGVRLQSLKYGAATREGAKGTDLEILDVEFTVSGIYQNVKPFMLGLEDTREYPLPFAIAGAKLEESPDGARLSVTLRAFRRATRQEGS
jgi:Tfp pilus assembly protein PilO